MASDFFKHKRLLITGGNGYIAYNIIRRLIGTKLRITRFDLRIDDWTEFSNSGIVFRNIEGDIRDSKLVESLLPDHDVIFHLAAQTSSYVADSDPLKDAGINLLPLITILDSCHRQSLKPVIIMAGTATQAGLTRELPVNEGFEDHPVTIYDLHKLFAEKYLSYYCEKGVLKGAVLRLANVYGPGPESSSQDRGIITLMIRKAVNKLPLTLYDSGQFTRDFIFVADVAEAFLNSVEYIDNLNGRHFYIGSGNGLSIAEMFDAIAERTYLKLGYRPEIRNVGTPPGLSPIEKRNFIADITKFSSLTGWLPGTEHEKGIDLTIEHFLKLK